MGITKKIRALHKQLGEVPFLFLCLALWVVVFSLVLLVSGNASVLPGFLLGSGGSGWYAWLLYRRVPAMLAPKGGSQSAGPNYKGPGWLKTVLPVVSITLIILAVSRFFAGFSFLAALFGFFSFQISLLLYMVLISIYPSFWENE